jgi:cobalamin biosynthesis Co2+ chelatase CbiK
MKITTAIIWEQARLAGMEYAGLVTTMEFAKMKFKAAQIAKPLLAFLQLMFILAKLLQ